MEDQGIERQRHEEAAVHVHDMANDNLRPKKDDMNVGDGLG
jgi:hypothetical protein